MLDLALRAAVVLFMVAGLAGAGLDVAPRSARAALGDGRFVALTAVGAWVLSPALAWLLLLLIPIAAPYATGLLLLALAPCAPFAPARVREAGGDTASMAAFVVLTAAGTVVVMPLAVPMIVGGAAVDPAAIARPLVLFVLLPLGAGMTMRAISPRVADRLRNPLDRIMRVATAALLVLVAVIHGASVLQAVGSYSIAVEILFVAGVTLASYVLGGGLPHAQRVVLTIGLSTRNLGAALAPLAAIDADPRAMVMIVVAVPLTLGASAIAARLLASPLTAPPAEST